MSNKWFGMTLPLHVERWSIDGTVCWAVVDAHSKQMFDRAFEKLGFAQAIVNASKKSQRRLSDEALKQLEDLVEIWEDDAFGGDEDSGQVAVALSLLLEWYKEEHV